MGLGAGGRRGLTFVCFTPCSACAHARHVGQGQGAGYVCVVLRWVPSAPQGPGCAPRCLLSPPTPAFVPAEPQYFRFEGVWLTETGMAVLRNLTMSPLHKRRQRKAPRLGALNGDGGLEGGDPLGPDEKKDGDLDADELLKAEGAPSPVGELGEGAL